MRIAASHHINHNTEITAVLPMLTNVSHVGGAPP